MEIEKAKIRALMFEPFRTEELWNLNSVLVKRKKSQK